MTVPSRRWCGQAVRRRVRDSKDRQGPVLAFSRFEWECFINGARNGEFDN